MQQEQCAEGGRGLTGKPLLGIALTRQPLEGEGVLHSPLTLDFPFQGSRWI